MDEALQEHLRLGARRDGAQAAQTHHASRTHDLQRARAVGDATRRGRRARACRALLAHGLRRSEDVSRQLARRLLRRSLLETPSGQQPVGASAVLKTRVARAAAPRERALGVTGVPDERAIPGVAAGGGAGSETLFSQQPVCATAEVEPREARAAASLKSAHVADRLQQRAAL